MASNGGDVSGTPSVLCKDSLHHFSEWVVCDCAKQGSGTMRAEAREGLLTVYDSTGQYVGCIGEETWEKLVRG